MRSSAGGSRGDVPLPFEVASCVPAEAPASVGSETTPPAGTTRSAGSGRWLHRLVGSHLVSRGLPPGSEILVDPRRPRRGEVALVRSGGRLRVGVFDLELGRAVLRSDRGTRWLDADAVYVGVAALVGAPLDGIS